jgi:anti-sigma-K factor RskA
MTGAGLNRERLAELLADEVTGDLRPEDLQALEELPAARREAHRAAYLQAAGIAQLAFLHGDQRPATGMPPALRARLAREGLAWQAGHAATPVARVTDLAAARRERQPSAATAATVPPRRDWGWYAAAALAVLLVASLVRTPPAPESTPTLAAQREALLARADTRRIAWVGSAEAGTAGVQGDIVWSDAEQAGFIRVTGLAANDPAIEQYQLWIVDPERDTRPVDGGVFDVGSQGEVIIAVRARLPVDDPQVFAITRERPGGVVVSDGPMLLTAST